MFKNEVSGFDWALGLVSTSGILLTTNLHLNYFVLLKIYDQMTLILLLGSSLLLPVHAALTTEDTS